MIIASFCSGFWLVFQRLYDYLMFCRHSTMVQNNHKASRPIVRLFACIVHSFACSIPLSLIAHSTALTHSLVRSLCSLPCSLDRRLFYPCFIRAHWIDGYLIRVFSRVHATLQVTLSVCRSVGLSVGRSVGRLVGWSVCPTLLFLRF